MTETNGETAESTEVMDLLVESPAAGGESIARHNGQVVFVSGAIPGETVRAAITEKKKRMLRADVIEVLEPSEFRVPDRRASLGADGVGGMEYSHVDLAHSRELKRQAAADQFTRLGGLDLTPDVLPAAREAAGGSGLDWRTRIQLAVDTTGRPGMYAARSHTVLPVRELPLAVPALAELGVHHLSLPGLTRIELAAGHQCGALVAHGQANPQTLEVLESALADAPGEWSLLVRSRGAGRNRRGGASGSLLVLRGTGEVIETVKGIDRSFRLRADGFWQVHVDAADELSARVVELTAGSASVLDLYCGAGLFSVAIASAHGIPVHGIEGSAPAVESATANAAGLGAEFTVARIEQLPELPMADTVVLDPPRSGAGAAVTGLLGASAAERIVYVSCDGATFARDAKALAEHGFRLASTEAHDYFPLTAHTEFVSVLTR
ncbi:TRAM domain-containing protein [Brevibacterium daeguense]|uniref:TRAM domain-containing protein n=1 Tax=Brevibacterium daeguense TaxID=909936 RepID=A0ABP8EN37_9MICO|nr:TRAM domain-containing protein [Brevibacterium daeguense]